MLVYAPYIGHGGVRRFTHRLLTSMISVADPAQWSFKVLSQPVDGQGHDINWPNDIFIPILGDRIRDNLGGRLCDFLQSNQNKFWAKFKQHAAEADIVWLPQPWWTLRAVDAVFDLPAHLVPTLHDFAFDHLEWKGLFGDRFRDEARNLIDISTRVIFSSNSTADHAVSAYNMQPSKRSVVYLADFLPESFSASELNIYKHRLKFGLPKRYWLAFHCMGHKDPVTILKALAETKRILNQSDFIPLVVAGIGSEALIPASASSTPSQSDICVLVQELGLVYGVDYYVAGFIDDCDIPALYAGATAALVASKSEAGLSASIFEAFFSATPVIHSDIIPFVERLGSDNKYALRFQVGNYAELSSAMIHVLADTSLARARARAAFQAFCSRGWQDVAREYLSIFCEIHNEGPNKHLWFTPKQTIQQLKRKERLRIKNREISVQRRSRSSIWKVLRHFVTLSSPRVRGMRNLGGH